MWSKLLKLLNQKAMMEQLKSCFMMRDLEPGTSLISLLVEPLGGGLTKIFKMQPRREKDNI